jgi:hypothetical protein
MRSDWLGSQLEARREGAQQFGGWLAIVVQCDPNRGVYSSSGGGVASRNRAHVNRTARAVGGGHAFP